MKKPPFLFYGWIIVGIGIASYSFGYGARYSFSVIFPSLLAEFHWPRHTTAAMLSVHMLAYGIVAPFAGAWVDRIGPRITMTIGTVLLALGLVLSALGNVPWHFYLSFGVLAGAGLCLIGAVPLTSIIRNWFERRRGLALSILFFGAGGSYALYPAVAALVDHLSWRTAFVVEGIVVAGVMLPLIIFLIRYHPREKGLHPDGDATAGGTAANMDSEARRITNRAWAVTEWTLAKAARTRQFWLLCLATFALWGIMQHIMVAHHVAFAADLGFSEMYASSVLSLIGVLFAFGSLLAFISDRIGREPTMMIGTVAGIAGILALTLMQDDSRPWMLYVYAVGMGLGAGLTAPTIAATATDIFQGPRVGTVIGFVWFSFSVGGFIGPWLGGWLFELTHSYVVAFTVAMAAYAIGCAAICLAAPRKVRLVPGRVNALRQR
jgi:MFS family permease